MSKFAGRAQRPNVSHVVTSEVRPSGRTFEGGDGYARDAKSELFLLAVTNMVGEKTFYESAEDRDERFEQLVHAVTKEDPAWVRSFVPWLRQGANMRSASLVAAAEYVNAGGEHGRQVVDGALVRADEPAEMLAYWHVRHGRRVPMPVKRGVADAVVRLYTERNALKWDGQGKAWRMGDVIELVHPKPQSDWQTALFKYLIDKRHGRGQLGNLPEETPLPLIARDLFLQSVSDDKRRLFLRDGYVASVGWSWERLAGWLPGGMDAEAWEAVISNMGLMALIRNLRNFDQVGISSEAVKTVQAKITNPDDVKGSRVLPMRFLAAYNAVESERWKSALDEALTLSLQNVPALSGRTLVLLDVSGSMVSAMSNRSELQRWEGAGIFGAALALRADSADFYAYSSMDRWRLGDGAGQRSSRIEFGKGASVFTVLKRVRECPSFGGGTETWQAVQETYKGHDRVIIVTDEQAFAGGGDPGPKAIPVIHTFNVGGYRMGHGRTGDRGRYTFAGLSDAAFTALPLIEGLKDGVWPWEA